MHPLILSFLGNSAIAGAALKDLRRFKPSKRPASAAKNDLGNAYASAVTEKTGKAPLPIQLQENTPRELGPMFKNPDRGQGLLDIAQELNAGRYASVMPMVKLDAQGKANVSAPLDRFQVNINPNAAEELLAHELGHAVNYQTKVGHELMKMRMDPKLARAVGIGGGLTAMAAAGLTPGDDDLDEAILGSMALSAPTLIDEAMASTTALNLMNRAGRPATLGQKGRLAGAYLTYLAAPASTAVLANTLGNQFDENV